MLIIQARCSTFCAQAQVLRQPPNPRYKLRTPNPTRSTRGTFTAASYQDAAWHRIVDNGWTPKQETRRKPSLGGNLAFSAETIARNVCSRLKSVH